jgi:ribosomal protein S6E (S10)
MVYDNFSVSICIAPTAADIDAGTFPSGQYTIPDNLTVGKYLAVNGSTFYVNALNGNVGIGTASPATKLHVNDTSTMTPMTIEGSASGSYINLKSAGLSKGYIGWTTSGDDGIAIMNGSGANVSVLITDLGKVGIGTSTPLNKLSVSNLVNATTGTNAAQAEFYGGSDRSGFDYRDGQIVVGTTANVRGSLLWNNGAGYVALENQWNDSAGDIRFRTRTKGTAVDAMIIEGDGNVGIGTTTPGALLHVAGNIRLSGNLLDTNGNIIFAPEERAGAVNYLTVRSGETGVGTGIFAIGADTNISLNLRGKGTGGVWIDDTFANSFEFHGSAASGATMKTTAGDLILKSASVEGLRIQSTTGNVGIGTTNPTNRLQIIQANDAWGGGIRLQESGGSGYGAGFYRGAGSTGAFIINNNGLDTVAITSGNVGIGTIAPAYKLDVNGTSRYYGNMYVEQAVNLSFANGQTIYDDGAAGLTIKSPTHNLKLYSGSTAGSIIFYTNATTERMRITQDGKVGIGTSTPGTDSANSYSGMKLEVTGGSDSRGVLDLGQSSTTDESSIGILGFLNKYNNDTSGATRKPIAYIAGYVETTDSVAHFDSGGHLAFVTKPEAGVLTERMRIGSTGNVGIGTTTPTQKLDVQGTMNVSNITLKANCADGEILKWASGVGKCGTDTDSTEKLNRTVGQYATNITAAYQAMPNLTLNLASSGVSNIECNLLNLANATATGVQLNVTITGSTSLTTFIEYFTSDTAKAICSGTTQSVTCASASSAGTTITNTRILANSIRSGAGTFTIELKTEAAGPLGFVNITAGSWCRAVET